MLQEIISMAHAEVHTSKIQRVNLVLIEIEEEEEKLLVRLRLLTTQSSCTSSHRKCRKSDAEEQQGLIYISMEPPHQIACLTFPCVAQNKALRSSGLVKRDGGRRLIKESVKTHAIRNPCRKENICELSGKSVHGTDIQMGVKIRRLFKLQYIGPHFPS